MGKADGERKGWGSGRVGEEDYFCKVAAQKQQIHSRQRKRKGKCWRDLNLSPVGVKALYVPVVRAQIREDGFGGAPGDSPDVDISPSSIPFTESQFLSFNPKTSQRFALIHLNHCSKRSRKRRQRVLAAWQNNLQASREWTQLRELMYNTVRINTTNVK